MKVLQINITVNVGSTGRIAEQIGLAVMERGGESYIAHGIDAAISQSKVITIASRWNYRIHRNLSKWTDMQGRFSTFVTMRLVRKIKKIAPDIIHLHNIHGSYINYKVLFNYLSKANIPVVWTLHDCWSMTGHCAHFVYAKCDKWKSGCYECPEQHSYPQSKFFDRSRKNYIEKREIFTSVKNLTIVPVSKWLGSVVEESYLQNSAINVIYNGIDVSTFRPIMSSGLRKQYNIPEHKKIIMGAATTWSAHKGFDDFVKLYELLPKDRYQIVMIGLNPSQQDRVPKGILGLPRTENVEALAEWYSVSDVFVNMSKAESFGLTTAEALASGTPAVVYNNTANPELIEPTIGRVVANESVEAVAEAIEVLCSEDRESMRKRCREYATAHFDKRDCFKKYIDLYEKLTNNNI